MQTYSYASESRTVASLVYLVLVKNGTFSIFSQKCMDVKMWQRQKVTYLAIIFYNNKINKNRRGTKNLTKETMFLRKFLEFFLCFLKITFLISNVLETKNIPRCVMRSARIWSWTSRLCFGHDFCDRKLRSTQIRFANSVKTIGSFKNYKTPFLVWVNNNSWLMCGPF